MPSTYKTKQGDTWDGVAKTQMGAESGMTTLMQANYSYVLTAVFPAGVTLTVPDYTATAASVLPPWRQ